MLEVLMIYGVMGAAMSAAAVLAGAAQFKTRRSVQRVHDAWSAYAELRQLGYEAPYGSWYERHMPRIHGSSEGVGYFLSPMDLNSTSLMTPVGHKPAGDVEPYTIVSGQLSRALPGLLVVFNRERSTTMERPLGFRDIDMSDADFASTCVVWSDGEPMARMLLDSRTRKALLRLASRGFVLTVNDGAVWIRWPGYETDPGVLDAAREAMVSLGRPRYKDSV